MAAGKRQRTADDPADDALLPGDGGNDDASEEALVEVEAEGVEIEVEVEIEEFASEVEPAEAPKADL